MVGARRNGCAKGSETMRGPSFAENPTSVDRPGAVQRGSAAREAGLMPRCRYRWHARRRWECIQRWIVRGLTAVIRGGVSPLVRRQIHGGMNPRMGARGDSRGEGAER